MKELKTNSYKLFLFLCNTLGEDIERYIRENKSLGMQSLSKYFTQRALFDIYCSYNEGDYDFTYIKSYNLLISTIPKITEKKLADKNRISAAMRELNEFIEIATTFISEYKEWEFLSNKTFRDLIFKNPLLSEEEKSEDNFLKIEKLWIDDIQKNFKGANPLLKVRNYRTVQKLERKDYQYCINNTFTLCNDLNLFFKTIKIV